MKNVLKKAALLVGIPILFATACNNTEPSASGKTEHVDEQIYACPMHPDITGNKGEKCPKCGMEMQPVDGSDKKDYRMEMKATGSIKAGQKTTFNFVPKNNSDSAALVELEVQHERKFHLIVVSQDLAWFHHIHPEIQADGSYTVSETFPGGGDYLLYADYKPVDGEKQGEKIPVVVEGKKSIASTFTEESLIAQTDGYTISITNGADIQTNRNEHLAISVEQNGKTLKEADLEKYLGASAHIVIINAENKEFLHIHPVSNPKFPIYGQTSFSKPGIYRMWVQFQIKGKLYTEAFTLDVKQGSGEMKEGSHSGH